MARSPTVLAVDDQPDSLESIKVVLAEARVLVRGPWEVTDADVKDADLVLVDLKLSDWSDRRASGILGTWPEDGFALLGNLRSHLGRVGKATPTSFAIHSSHLDEVFPHLPAEYRAHALARLHDLEWIFTKAQLANDNMHQVLSLAQATRGLPMSWPEGDFAATRLLVMQLLGLRKKLPWIERAWEDVWECHPPIHDLASPTHGLVFLRWLLQRILPYPCFLWDERQLAARLGMAPAGLALELEDKPVAAGLRQARYSGLLNDFLGPRWWRTGVEAFMWELTSGASTDWRKIRAALESGGVKHASLEPDKNTICLDEAFLPLTDMYSVNDCVRIQPDDWPPYADPPWTTIELARSSSKLASLVVDSDRDRIAS